MSFMYADETKSSVLKVLIPMLTYYIISCSMKCPAYYKLHCTVLLQYTYDFVGIVFISKTSCRDVRVVENYMLPSSASQLISLR